VIAQARGRRPSSSSPRARGAGVAVGALAVFAVALAVRLAWVRGVSNPFDNIYSDMGGYIDRALRLVGARPPGFVRDLGIYPFGTHTVYAAEMELVGWQNHGAFAFVHCLWGAAVAPFTMLLALRVVAKTWVGVAVGLLVAVWQPLVVYSGFFSSEQLSSALFVANAWLLTRHVETGRGALATALTGALAYLVRPQFLLTAVLLAGAFWVARRRWPRRRIPLILGCLAVAIGVGVVRYTTLTNQFGLICDGDAMQRLFADTDIGIIESSDGDHNWFFAPPAKVQTGEMRKFSFRGFIGDRAPLEKARRDEVRRYTLGWRARHLLGNVALLVSRNELWPESDHARDRPWRREYNDFFKSLVLALLPLAALGLASTARRPRLVLVIAAAHVLTTIVTTALFYGEARYRVPYDAFLLLLALEGLAWLGALAGRLLARGARQGLEGTTSG
jgi:hypothetical protein